MAVSSFQFIMSISTGQLSTADIAQRLESNTAKIMFYKLTTDTLGKAVFGGRSGMLNV